MNDTCVYNILSQCKVDRVPIGLAYETLHAIVFISFPNHGFQMYTVKPIFKNQKIRTLRQKFSSIHYPKNNLLKPGY